MVAESSRSRPPPYVAELPEIVQPVSVAAPSVVPNCEPLTPPASRAEFPDRVLFVRVTEPPRMARPPPEPRGPALLLTSVQLVSVAVPLKLVKPPPPSPKMLEVETAAFAERVVLVSVAMPWLK